MTGSLQIKNGKFYAVLNITDSAGKRKLKWIGTDLPVRGNKRRAQEVLAAIIAECEEKKQAPEVHNILFAGFLQEWLNNKKGKVEMSTWEGYKEYTVNHIIPFFRERSLTLGQLSPRHFKDYYECKYRGGRLDGKEGGLSVRSIKSHSLIIKESLNQAVILEHIDRNPALHVPLPRQEEKKQVGTFLTVEQANEVLASFREHHLQPLVYVTLYYGLRRSEVVGLRWQAIDFTNNLLHINHTVVKNLTVVAKDKTKTAASKRTHELLPEVKLLLLQLKETAESNKKLFGNEYHDSDYIFVWPNGVRYSPDYVTRGFQRVLKAHGLPKMRFHDIRHSTASILYDKGWSLKDIQEWLGHADLQTTGDIYTHISNLRRHSMAKGIENTFSL